MAQRSRRPGPYRSYLTLMLLGAAIGLILAVVGGFGFVILLGSIAPADRLPATSVAMGVDVGNLTPYEAAAAVAAAANRPITLRDGARTWSVSSVELGIGVDVEATAARAAETLNSGALARLGKMMSGVEFAPVYVIDREKAANTIAFMQDAINIKPNAINAGRSVNIGASAANIPDDPEALLNGAALDLVMEIVEPPRTVYTVQQGEELLLIAKKFNVDPEDIIRLNNLTDPDKIYPGQQLVIPAAGIWVPSEKDAPPAPTQQGKAIIVKLREQRIYAYENGRLVRSALTSTGKLGTETVVGDYKIYVKYPVTRMRGPDYDIPDVPWTMYFHQGYGIHGAYWHNTFGRPRSHGCVNLEVNEAKWFYDFAPVGTLVRVMA